MNKTERILNHLKKYGRITSTDAFEKYHATRLSAIIFSLRKKYMIDTEYAYMINDEGRRIRYGIYRLVEQKDE